MFSFLWILDHHERRILDNQEGRVLGTHEERFLTHHGGGGAWLTLKGESWITMS